MPCLSQEIGDYLHLYWLFHLPDHQHHMGYTFHVYSETSFLSCTRNLQGKYSAPDNIDCLVGFIGDDKDIPYLFTTLES